MSESKTNTKPAQEAAQSTSEFKPLVSLSREGMEDLQTALATKLGCDREKKISGTDYLMIFVGSLQRAGIIAAAHVPHCYQAAKGMKANNSALRQWLYERQEKAEKPNEMAEKYKNLGA